MDKQNFDRRQEPVSIIEKDLGEKEKNALHHAKNARRIEQIIASRAWISDGSPIHYVRNQ